MIMQIVMKNKSSYGIKDCILYFPITNHTFNVEIFYLLLPHFKCAISTYAISPVIRIIFITENIILVEMVVKKWLMMMMMMIAARLYIYFPYGET